jgi:hypothetical protein
MIALGTTYAARLPPDEVLAAAESCGAGALVLCEGLRAELLGKGGLPEQALPIWAIDAQLGGVLRGREGLARAELCALDRDEARAAVSRVQACLALAEACGCPAVYLRLGTVAGVAGRWDGLRRRFLRGELLLDEEPAERLMRDRRALAERHLQAARRSLEPLLGEAERRGVTLLLKNPRRGIELPEALELSALLQEFAGAPLRPLLDLPAAHLTSAMRLFPLRETILGFADGPLCFLGDACGAISGLPPGHGEVDVAAVARHLPAEVRRAFVPWPGLRLHEVRAGVAGVAGLPAKSAPAL